MNFMNFLTQSTSRISHFIKCSILTSAATYQLLAPLPLALNYRPPKRSAQNRSSKNLHKLNSRNLNGFHREIRNREVIRIVRWKCSRFSNNLLTSICTWTFNFCLKSCRTWSMSTRPLRQKNPQDLKWKTTRKKCSLKDNLVKKLITADMLTVNTTQKGCAITVTINTAETKNLGIVLMISSMLTECVKTVT